MSEQSPPQQQAADPDPWTHNVLLQVALFLVDDPPNLRAWTSVCRAHRASRNDKRLIRAIAEERASRDGRHHAIIYVVHDMMRRHPPIPTEAYMQALELLLDDPQVQAELENDPDNSVMCDLTDESGAEQAFRLIVARHPSLLNRPNRACGFTPLHMAAMTGSGTHVRVLMDLGADPFAKTRQKNTALHYAANSLRVPCAAAILDGVADPAKKAQLLALRDGKGHTALKRVCLDANGRRGADHIAMINYLIEAGADPTDAAEPPDGGVDP